MKHRRPPPARAITMNIDSGNDSRQHFVRPGANNRHSGGQKHAPHHDGGPEFRGDATLYTRQNHMPLYSSPLSGLDKAIGRPGD